MQVSVKEKCPKSTKTVGLEIGIFECILLKIYHLQ
jgi:hypothetical protein